MSKDLAMQIRIAKKTEALKIATLIMEAMNHECCQWFAGPQHTLDDFHKLMTRLVESDNSQYSYTNTLVAINTEEQPQEIMGILVSYDGGQLHELRKSFIIGAQQAFGIDYSQMDDETQAGELYLDSLAVQHKYRHQGVATALLKAGIEKGRDMLLPSGLLVDQGNPNAEQLYRRLGFQYKNDAEWGGHPMRHLVFPL